MKFFDVLRHGESRLLGDHEYSAKDQCPFCNSSLGFKIAEVTYWDVDNIDIIQCPNCFHMRMDPILTDEQMAKGCNSYFVKEYKRLGLKWMKNNSWRRYRAGISLGLALSKFNKNPRRILELVLCHN